MKMLITYLFTYFKLKKRLSEVFKPYLEETKGEITVSFRKKQVVLKHYSAKALKGVEGVVEYINTSYPYFKVDKIKVDPFKIVLSQSTLPLNFKLPNTYQPQPNLIPIGVDDENKIIHISTIQTSSTGIFLQAGAGKTTYLLSMLKAIREHNYCGFNIFAYDPKNDGDYDSLESENFLIARSLEEAVNFHKQLKEEVENKVNKKWLIIAEEYVQWTDTSKYKNSKDKKEMAGELLAMIETAMQLYRSKGVHTILVSQNPNSQAQTVDTNNIANKIYGFVTNSQAQTQNIPPIFTARSDLIHGKFIISIANKEFKLMRGING